MKELERSKKDLVTTLDVWNYKIMFCFEVLKFILNKK